MVGVQKKIDGRIVFQSSTDAFLNSLPEFQTLRCPADSEAATMALSIGYSIPSEV